MPIIYYIIGVNNLNVTYNPVSNLAIKERKTQAILEIASSDLSLSEVTRICEKYNIYSDNIINMLLNEECLTILESAIRFKLLYGQIKAVETLQMGLLNSIADPKEARECAKELIRFGFIAQKNFAPLGEQTPFTLEGEIIRENNV